MVAGDSSTGLRLCIAMGPFWLAGLHWNEGIARLRAVLDLPGDDDRLRARALATAGQLLLLRGDLADADALFTEARTRAAAGHDDLALARALSGAGLIAFRASRRRSRRSCGQSLAARGAGR